MGILSVMESINMLPSKEKKRLRRYKEVYIVRSSHWIRALQSGSLRVQIKLDAKIMNGQLLPTISDPYGNNLVRVESRKTGIAISMTMLPLLNKGDAMFHIATFQNSEAVEERLEIFDETLDTE